MNTENTFTYKTPYAEYAGCRFRTAKYGNGNNALVIENDDGRLFTCSVNPGFELGEDMLAVKNWTENEGIDSLLVERGVVESIPVGRISSGFVEIPVYRLTPDGKRLFLAAA